jgi:hypothetical protein
MDHFLSTISTDAMDAHCTFSDDEKTTRRIAFTEKIFTALGSAGQRDPSDLFEIIRRNIGEHAATTQRGGVRGEAEFVNFLLHTGDARNLHRCAREVFCASGRAVYQMAATAQREHE